MGRLSGFATMIVVAAACQVPSSPVATPTPSPSPHAAVAAAGLQPGDVPSGLLACPGSGPIATYISGLEAIDPALAIRIYGQWEAMKGLGARDASVSIFTSDPAACTKELGSAAASKGAASLVAVFADEGQADRAWQGGVLGFVPPAPDQVAPGIKRGTGTGLGASSWTYDRTPVRLACWRRSVFVALVVLTNLDAASFKAATTAVDARLN